MNALRISLLLSTILLAFAAPTRAADTPSYRIVDRIKVPDGSFDYANYDPATGRIYMARTDSTTVASPLSWFITKTSLDEGS